MSRAERRHNKPQKKSYTGWIIFGVIVLLLGGIWAYDMNKGTGVDYTKYAFDDVVYESPNATVIIEEFSDFQCPACQAVEPSLKAIRDSYKGTVRLDYKQFPLRSIHEHAQGASEASECAREQGKFWAYHDVLFDSKLLDQRSLKLHAEGLGLDMNQWNACMSEGRAKPIVSATLLEGQGRGVQGTPTIFLNGQLFSGRSVQDFEAAIRQLTQ